MKKTQESVRKKWKANAGDWSRYRDEIGEVNLHENDVNKANRILIDKVHEVAERTLGHTKGRKKHMKNAWWNNEIKKERQEERIRVGSIEACVLS